MDFYRKNMRLIKKTNRSLYERLRDYDQSDDFEMKKNNNEQTNIVATVKDLKNDIKIVVEETRSNDYTIRVDNKDKDIYFHSKYNPIKEAERQIKNFKPKNDKQVFALGFGLGYHLNELAKRNRFDKIIIVEPYMSILYTALRFVDLSKILKNNNVIYIIEGKPKIFDIVRRYFSFALDKDLSFLEQKPSTNLFVGKYKEIYQKIREGINYKKTGLVTDIKKARKWRNNIILNLPYIFRNPKADDFFKEFKDIPVICVAAGPSLDKNIKEIKKAKGKALIMCVGTALKSLLKEDIKPDIVVSMEGNDPVYKQFEGLPVLEDVFLFLELGHYYKVQREWTGKQVYFTMKRNFSGWVEELKGEYTPIQTGGTVAHSMVDLAYKFGADPIILVGQDLAYSKNRTHASGTVYESQELDKENLIKVEGINQKHVLTSKSFLSMISYFNNYFSKRHDRTFIDATEGGARIEHTEIMKLKKVINKYCKDENMGARERLDNIYDKERPDMEEITSKLENQIKDTIKELERAIDLAKKQLSLVKNIENKLKIVNDMSDEDVNEINAKLKSYENELKKLDYIKYFIERILIIESMRYKEVKSKYYINNAKALKEKMKYYRTYRVNYLRELKKGRNLIMNYIKMTKNDSSEIKQREGLA